MANTSRTDQGQKPEEQPTSTAEPEPATKVTIIRNPAADAPYITSMSVSRGDKYEPLNFPDTETSWELSIEDARQVIGPERVEIPTGNDDRGKPKSPRVEYIPGFIVSPDSKVTLK